MPGQVRSYPGLCSTRHSRCPLPPSHPCRGALPMPRGGGVLRCCWEPAQAASPRTAALQIHPSQQPAFISGCHAPPSSHTPIPVPHKHHPARPTPCPRVPGGSGVAVGTTMSPMGTSASPGVPHPTKVGLCPDVLPHPGCCWHRGSAGLQLGLLPSSPAAQPWVQGPPSTALAWGSSFPGCQRQTWGAGVGRGFPCPGTSWDGVPVPGMPWRPGMLCEELLPAGWSLLSRLGPSGTHFPLPFLGSWCSCAWWRHSWKGGDCLSQECSLRQGGCLRDAPAGARCGPVLA